MDEKSSSSSSDNSYTRSPNKNKRKRSQKTTKQFQEEWLSDPSFKNWLEKTDDRSKSKCKICNKIMQSGKSEFLKHSQGAKHKKKMNAINFQQSVQEFTVKNNTHEDIVKIAEIKLCSFFAEHNVALQVVDHLIPLLKNTFKDSNIIADIQLKRTKCTEIVKNVLAATETNITITELKENKFSILVDKSTDISTTKNMCILVRYHCNGKIKTKLLELVKIDARNACASNLYNSFKICLEKKNIPLKNIIGVASDGCATMIGKHNSVFTHLKQDVPNVILMSCICHSAALIASKACEELPRSPEELIRSIYSYISGSSKRCAQLVEIQEFFKTEQKKILKLATTRWLSRHACVVRLLENYTVLENYFQIAVIEDKLKGADHILRELSNMYNKAYLYFLKYVLNIFNSFNAIFQSRDCQIHKLSSRCNIILKQLCQNFMKPEIIMEKNLQIINVKHPNYFLPQDKIYLSKECEEIVNNMPREGVHDFRLKCLNFYITAAFEMQQRLPLDNEMFQQMAFLDPTIALYPSGREDFGDINKLVEYFKDYIDCDAIEIEWRNLSVSFKTVELNKLCQMPIDEMWHYIGEIKDFDGNYSFRNIANLASLILTLPHSNAEAERIFSMVNDIKCKKRNKLSNEVLNSLCVFRSALQSDNKTCVEFDVTKDHLKMHNKNMYSFKETKQ